MDNETRAAANRIERLVATIYQAEAVATALADSGFILTGDMVRAMADRVAAGQCWARDNWCITHNVAYTMHHHFDQPGTQGHSRFGIAKND